MVDPIDIPHSTGWIAFAQLGGPAIAIGIANSVFLNKAQIGLKKLLPNMSTTDIRTVISDPSNSLLRDLPQSEQSQVVYAVVRSMSDPYILCIIGGSLVLLLIFKFKVNSKLYG